MRKRMNQFIVGMIICVLITSNSPISTWAAASGTDYIDDGVQCIPKDEFENTRVVSRRIIQLEPMGVKHSKWIRITDVYCANTGREHQSFSAFPVYKDKQKISISASATIPVKEFIDLSLGFEYDLTPNREEMFTSVPSTGDLRDGEYTAYYVRKSWQTYKATVETVYEYGNTFNDPANQVTVTTEEYYDSPLEIGPNDKTFIFSFDQSLLKKKLRADICDGYACTVGDGYDHPYVTE